MTMNGYVGKKFQTDDCGDLLGSNKCTVIARLYDPWKSSGAGGRTYSLRGATRAGQRGQMMKQYTTVQMTCS